MSRLSELFRQLQNDKDQFLGASSGKDFENRVRTALDKLRYTELPKEEKELAAHWDSIKYHCDDKWTVDSLVNHTRLKEHYVYQPFGSQRYPDILILDSDRIHILEMKFNEKSAGKPVWNGGLPRPTGIYVYGSYGRKDITFFMGASIVSPEEAKLFHEFFAEPKKREQDFNQQHAASQRYGFAVSVRRAFEQKKKYNDDAVLDFFNDDQRVMNESRVIDYIEGKDIF